MPIGLLLDASTALILDVPPDIGATVMMDVNFNAVAGVTAAFELVTSDPLDEFRCCAAFDCRPIDAFD